MVTHPTNHGRPAGTANTPPDDLGALVRTLRRARGLTLAQVAVQCSYSVSALSRMERGKQPLRDIQVIRSIAAALCVPPKVFGLAETLPRGVKVRPHGTMLQGATQASGEETDPMRRRTLITGLAGVAGTGTFGSSYLPAGPDGPLTSLVDAVLNPPDFTDHPVPPFRLRQKVAAAYSTFQRGRYLEVAARLPDLTSAALATRAGQNADIEVAAANRQLAEIYTLGSELMVKLCHDQLAWTTADRALQAAYLSHDAVTQAAARRAWAIVLRRAGRAEAAQRVVVDTAAALQPDLRAGAEHLAAYGALLATAAYTAAVDGDRTAARTLIAEAADAAGQVGRDTGRHTTFGPMRVDLYQVSIARVLGDSGTAIEAARRVNPAAIETAEQRARFWANVARSFHQWGKAEPCYRALLEAERAAPDEVRYRKPIQQITVDLLRHPAARRLPGLRGFAARTGISG